MPQDNIWNKNSKERPCENRIICSNLQPIWNGTDCRKHKKLKIEKKNNNYVKE